MRKGNATHPLIDPVRIPEEPEALEDGLFRLRYHVTDDLLDRIAAGVAQLPVTLTFGQREKIRVIAKELTRRSK